MALTSIAGTNVLINNETVASTATVYSNWIQCQAGYAFQLWLLIDNASSSPELNVYLDSSPFTANDTSGYLNYGGVASVAPTGTDVTKYITVTVATAVTTKNQLIAYRDASLDFPFLALRVRVTGTASNGANTKVTVLMTRYD
jgi:hypothetical protein